MTFTEEHLTGPLVAALEKWLDYCSRMSVEELQAFKFGLDRASAIGFSLGDVELAGGFLALADLIEQMRLACIAIQDENEEANDR